MLFIIICIFFIFLLLIKLGFPYVIMDFNFMRMKQRHFNFILVTEIS